MGLWGTDRDTLRADAATASKSEKSVPKRETTPVRSVPVLPKAARQTRRNE